MYAGVAAADKGDDEVVAGVVHGSSDLPASVATPSEEERRDPSRTTNSLSSKADSVRNECITGELNGKAVDAVTAPGVQNEINQDYASSAIEASGNDAMCTTDRLEGRDLVNTRKTEVSNKERMSPTWVVAQVEAGGADAGIEVLGDGERQTVILDLARTSTIIKSDSSAEAQVATTDSVIQVSSSGGLKTLDGATRHGLTAVKDETLPGGSSKLANIQRVDHEGKYEVTVLGKGWGKTKPSEEGG